MTEKRPKKTAAKKTPAKRTPTKKAAWGGAGAPATKKRAGTAPRRAVPARVTETDRKVLAGRLAGLTFVELAKELKVRGGVEGAKRGFARAQAEHELLPLGEARRLEVIRLERLRAVMWAAIESGEWAAYDRLALIEARLDQLRREGMVPEDRILGPLERATVDECQTLSAAAPSLAAAAIAAARLHDESTGRPTAAAAALREHRMAMDRLRGLMGGGKVEEPTQPTIDPNDPVVKSINKLNDLRASVNGSG